MDGKRMDPKSKELNTYVATSKNVNMKYGL